MRVSKFICSTAVLAVTVSSSPTGLFNLQWLEGRSSDASTLANSQLKGRANPQLRLLVAGASIANGKKSADENGFRLRLEDALVAAGNDVRMVGTVKAGSMKDNACEAIPGDRIDQVTARLVAALPKISPPPNIVLVQAGANDLGQGASVDTMQQRITALVDLVCTTIPGVNVILSTLLPSEKTEPGVLAYNAKLRDVVEAQNKQGRHLYLADVHSSEFSTADINPLPDGTHPTAEGYVKMARVYTGVVLAVVKERFASATVLAASISNPAPTPSSSAPAKSSANSHFSQSSLITAVIMLAWAIPLFAV